MNSKKLVTAYMNLFARGFAILHEYSDNEIFNADSLADYKSYSKIIADKFSKINIETEERLISSIESILSTIIEDNNPTSRLVSSKEFCLWMDHFIEYESDFNVEIPSNKYKEKPFHIILDYIVPKSQNSYEILESLNTNREDTGIWINPKLTVAVPYQFINSKHEETDEFEQSTKKDHAISNRDIFFGINRELNNCSYFRCNGENQRLRVTNVIFSKDFFENNHDILHIAFAPITDNKNLFTDENTQYLSDTDDDGFAYNNLIIGELPNPKELTERLIRDWKLAADKNTDIFFAPEMLGSSISEMSNINNTINSNIYKASKELQLERKNVPSLTLLPSYWRDRMNSVTIANKIGSIIGLQYKHIPLIDRKNHWREGLKKLEHWDFLLLHIKGYHRIAIMICAEFLAGEQNELFDFICGSLGATLILVPSYTSGEQDFLNSLSHLKKYGTTVVWGNCCGAPSNPEKSIGGCSMAGSNSIQIFGSNCQCGNTCKDISACIFLLNLPLHFESHKNIDPDEFKIEHYYLSIITKD